MFAQHGQCKQALLLDKQMQMSILKPNSHTFVAVVKMCAGTKASATGTLIYTGSLVLEFLEMNCADPPPT